jgi:HEAT repeat protein
MIELATALQAEPAATRWHALVQINRASAVNLADVSILSTLTSALADEHAFVRWQVGQLLAGQAEGRQKLTELLKNYPTLPSETLANQTNLCPDLLYSAAIDALTTQSVGQIKDYLTGPLHSGQPLLRQSAAEALFRQPLSSEVWPHLLAALKDDNPWVRRAALIALGYLGDDNLADKIAVHLSDKAVIVRRSAAYALGALRAGTALSALKIALTDGDPQVRRNAAWALGRLGRAEVLADLTRLLEDETLNGAVAAAAEEAIKAIKKPLWQRILPARRPNSS